MTCPSCGKEASGSFCSSCGTTLGGVACANCATSLTPGARFCHRCGSPAGAAARAPRGLASVMPWAFAGIALVALISLLAAQKFASRNTGALGGSQGEQAAPAMPRAPDISQMSPTERAERLYDRIMRESEGGNLESARTFVPMAVAAYEALSPMTADHRYDLGRIGVVAGDTALARAQADTILAAKPTHLLGLILASQVARMERQDAKARDFDARFFANANKERASNLPEYAQHANDIQAALAAVRTPR